MNKWTPQKRRLRDALMRAIPCNTLTVLLAIVAAVNAPTLFWQYVIAPGFFSLAAVASLILSTPVGAVIFVSLVFIVKLTLVYWGIKSFRTIWTPPVRVIIYRDED